MQVPRKSLFAILAQITQFERLAILRLDFFCRPHGFVETLGPSVQRVLAVIFRQRVGLSVQLELRVPDAVSVAANQGAKITRVAHIPVNGIKAEHYVAELPIAIRHFQRNDRPAIICDCRFGTVLVRQRIQIHFLPVRRLPERRFLRGTRFCPHARKRTSPACCHRRHKSGPHDCNP